MLDENLYKFMQEIAPKWEQKDIKLPIGFQSNIKVPIVEMLNSSLMQRRSRGQLSLPNFSATDTVLIFSDYGGESSDSKFSTYSFVFVDYDTVGLFSQCMKALREKYFQDTIDKEIAFKDARFGPINRCMIEFLAYANNYLNGVVFTLIVEREIISLFSSNSVDGLKNMVQAVSDNNMGEWKGRILEKGMRIIHAITYFCKLLIPEGKNVFWMSDSDSIMPNNAKEKELTGMLSNCINNLNDHPKYKSVCYSPKPFDFSEDTYNFRDVLSIADLVAGSIEHYLTRNEKMDDLTINNVADTVLKWLTGQGIGMRKLNFIIKKTESGFGGGFWETYPTEPLTNIVHIKYDAN